MRGFDRWFRADPTAQDGGSVRNPTPLNDPPHPRVSHTSFPQIWINKSTFYLESLARSSASLSSMMFQKETILIAECFGMKQIWGEGGGSFPTS